MKITSTSRLARKVVRYGTRAAGYAMTFILAVPFILACLLAGWVFQTGGQLVHRHK